MMFMSSGIIMMFEELLPERAFMLSGEFVQMNFLRSVYFMIVTMSTLGYGEFYPGHTYVRLWLMVTLLAYVVILSNDLSALSECMKNMSEYDTHYYFENHIVIVGRYNDFYLWDFVKNFYADIESDKKLHKETKVIIVGGKEPSCYLEYLLDDLEL